MGVVSDRMPGEMAPRLSVFVQGVKEARNVLRPVHMLGIHNLRISESTALEISP